jgi:hypothetical protein
MVPKSLINIVVAGQDLKGTHNLLMRFSFDRGDEKSCPQSCP